mgnify:CR=1 FL=1
MTNARIEYFRELKRRLANRSYLNNSAAKERNKQYFLNNKKLSPEEVECITVKIEEINSSEEFIVNPLSRMILDTNDFDRLDDMGKVRYMLELSNVYLQMRATATKNQRWLKNLIHNSPLNIHWISIIDSLFRKPEKLSGYIQLYVEYDYET